MILRVFVLLLLIFFYITFIEIPTQYNNHLDGNFVKNELIKYHQKNGMYPTSINQMDNLVTINNNIYIYNKETEHFMEYTAVLDANKNVIQFRITVYDNNNTLLSNIIYDEEDLNE